MTNNLKIAKVNQIHVIKSEIVNGCNYTISTVTSHYTLVCKSGNKYVDVLNNKILNNNEIDALGYYYEIDSIVDFAGKKRLIKKLHI